jgi:hypothetical protein
VVSVLTGQYDKDLQLPVGSKTTSRTLPTLLRETHCNIAAGKTWDRSLEPPPECAD